LNNYCQITDSFYFTISARAVTNAVNADISIPAFAKSNPSFFGFSGTKMLEPGFILGYILKKTP
jgi:hypothetical protein